MDTSVSDDNWGTGTMRTFHGGYFDTYILFQQFLIRAAV